MFPLQNWPWSIHLGLAQEWLLMDLCFIGGPRLNRCLSGEAVSDIISEDWTQVSNSLRRKRRECEAVWPQKLKIPEHLAGVREYFSGKASG